MDDFVIVKEHPSLIEYIDGLQRKNAEALSFYPKQVFEREAAWRKHKQTGIITQFSRGAKLDAYRLKIIGLDEK